MRIIVLKIINGIDLDGGVEWVNGTFLHFEKDSYLECDNLKKGTYKVYVEWDWQSYVPNEKKVFCISSYGPSAT